MFNHVLVATQTRITTEFPYARSAENSSKFRRAGNRANPRIIIFTKRVKFYVQLRAPDIFYYFKRDRLLYTVVRTPHETTHEN